VNYLKLIKDSVSPQIARSVLPTCLKTEFVATANFREWHHFLKLRTAAAAHPQMREVAGMIKAILVAECPAVFEEIV
jgi:thymidylate synthase (FAD)